MLAKAPVALELIGSPEPRLAPPVPMRHGLDKFRATAEGMGITLMPWQETAARYLTAIGPDGGCLYREVAIVVARQQGKTHLMKPYILDKLRDGKQVLHIAQVRELPRQMFRIIASELDESLFLRQRGKAGKMVTLWPRFGSGSEEILLANGGSYRIAAANRGSARGQTADVVVIDELREMDDYGPIDATESTTLTRADAQIVYLSNAGNDQSIVLNDVRDRFGQDESLAYLEWSADPDLAADDRRGWAQANPSLGHIPTVEASLERIYTRHRLAGSLASFETENLCRWVKTMRESLVSPEAWDDRAGEVGVPVRPAMGIALDPSGRRASAALAWPMPDGSIRLRHILEGTGDPIDPAALGKDLRAKVREFGVVSSGFDPLTDALLAKYLRRPEALPGVKHANATAAFVSAIETKRLVWEDSAQVGDDLGWTARKANEERGSFQAVRADDGHPITAALAAIRAVWMASAPRPEPTNVHPASMGF